MKGKIEKFEKDTKAEGLGLLRRLEKALTSKKTKKTVKKISKTGKKVAKRWQSVFWG